MSKYNFEKSRGEFDETIKLDGLNRQVREERASGRNGGGGGKRKKRRRKRKGGFFFPALIIGIIAAIIIFILVFAFTGGLGSKPSPDLTDDQTTGKEGFYALINSKNSNGKVGFYDFEHDVIYNMPIDNNTVVTDSIGSKLNNNTVEVGDIVKAYIDFDSKQVLSVNYTDDTWKRDNILGSAVSFDESTVTVGSTVYNYTDGLLVSFEDSIISLGDISDNDVVCVQGYENNIWSVRVKESGGYITVMGWEEIENGTLSVDGGAEIQINKEKIDIAGGKHTITIKGDNIEEYVADVYITPGSEVGINLEDMVNSGVLVFKANTDNYDLYINGSLYDRSGECELPYGNYTLSVVKDGYNTWFRDITLDKSRMEVVINLEKIVTTGRITIYSQPAAAEIYIDEEFVGRAPVMLEKPYGDYVVRAVLEDYPESIDVVTVSGADMSYTAKLVLEDE